ncbi:hypothetical protein EC9_32630 [Rosistilla ulvae]|uniref:Uncharacterized protein n=1 Tax=Rosistilla ulvae TaxID=1930277 RepID=A0A517M2G7_9BACT|nr:hypothetical protein EC9_32630 [Rosistilla ulvae]
MPLAPPLVMYNIIKIGASMRSGGGDIREQPQTLSLHPKVIVKKQVGL